MDRGVVPHRRRRAREIALQLIYLLDVRPELSPRAAKENYPFLSGDGEDIISYAMQLVEGVADRGVEIDALIREHIVGWRLERMATVDRSIISLALYEGLLENAVPVAIAISEAVELAKRFGTEESPRFVNGVLGKIVRSQQPDVEAADEG